MSRNTKHDMKLSVVLATLNEEENIAACIESVKSIADEIVVVDESSTDNTQDIAKSLGARVFKVKHEPIFHKTKQKAINKATGDWILQLDADERVTNELAEEISSIMRMSNKEIAANRSSNRSKYPKLAKLFQKHQTLIERRDGKLGSSTGEVVAFFVPRVNFFLGKPLKYAGVYPDGVIRLIKHGCARLPGKSVHELMEIDGEVDWLFSDLQHHDSPTLQRYLKRANRYTDLTAKQFKSDKVGLSYFTLLYYSFIKPFIVFCNLYFRHKGLMDGMRGFIWSLFSALHFPLAYFKYWQSKKE